MAAVAESDANLRSHGADRGIMDSSFPENVMSGSTRKDENTKKGRKLLSSEDSVDDTEEEDEMETRCGAGSWRPSWLQKLAKPEVYAVMHAMLSFVIFADAMYFVGTLSTVEKHLKIPSRTTGFMYSSFEIGSLVAMPIVGYAARHVAPMLLVCSGTALTGFACFCFALPYFIFGAGSDAVSRASITGDVFLANAVEVNSSVLLNEEQPGKTESTDCSSDGDSSSWPVILFCIANLLVGIGTSAHYTVGLAYLDNNSSKNKSPILLAATSCVQMLGSTLGYSVASMALAYYVIPSLTPPFDNSDPRWIGAWWLGWPLMGTLTVAVGCLTALFPRRLPEAAERRRKLRSAGAGAEVEAVTVSVQDLKLTIWRLLKNKILVFNTCSTICLMFGYASYWTFLHKYIETQFQKSASEANIITGSMTQVFTGAGVMAAAVFITRFKPEPRKIAAWNVLTEVVDALGHFSWAFLGCSVRDDHGIVDNSGIFTASCNTSIICGPDPQIAPVCSQNTDTTFYSPCFAGCEISQTSDNGTKIFSDCACIPNGMAVDGPCSAECGSSFMAFIMLQCVLSFLQASGRSGNILLEFRCLDEKDKSLAIALTQIVLSVLVFFPAPTIYGALLDSTCLFWEKSCGSVGNCWVYDKQKMRYLLNFTATGCLIVGVIFDIGVWMSCSGLKIYDEDDVNDLNYRLAKNTSSASKPGEHESEYEK